LPNDWNRCYEQTSLERPSAFIGMSGLGQQRPPLKTGRAFAHGDAMTGFWGFLWAAIYAMGAIGPDKVVTSNILVGTICSGLLGTIASALLGAVVNRLDRWIEIKFKK
jgi:hypothetical protein